MKRFLPWGSKKVDDEVLQDAEIIEPYKHEDFLDITSQEYEKQSNEMFSFFVESKEYASTFKFKVVQWEIQLSDINLAELQITGKTLGNEGKTLYLSISFDEIKHKEVIQILHILDSIQFTGRIVSQGGFTKYHHLELISIDKIERGLWTDLLNQFGEPTDGLITYYHYIKCCSSKAQKDQNDYNYFVPSLIFSRFFHNHIVEWTGKVVSVQKEGQNWSATLEIDCVEKGYDPKLYKDSILLNSLPKVDSVQIGQTVGFKAQLEKQGGRYSSHLLKFVAFLDENNLYPQLLLNNGALNNQNLIENQNIDLIKPQPLIEIPDKEEIVAPFTYGFNENFTNFVVQPSAPLVDEIVDRDLCKICFEKEIDTVLLECAHTCLCNRCSNLLSNCPICNTVITRRVLMYKQ